MYGMMCGCQDLIFQMAMVAGRQWMPLHKNMVYHKVGKLLHAWLPLMVLVHIGKFLKKNIFWLKKNSFCYDKIPLIYINQKEQELLYKLFIISLDIFQYDSVFLWSLLWENLEDTKGVIRKCIWKIRSWHPHIIPYMEIPVKYNIWILMLIIAVNYFLWITTVFGVVT
jgi:hypothetical protein